MELAVNIRTTERRVRRRDALKHVFDYSVMIDISARGNRRAGQWIFSKGQDTYAPFGPCIVTADDIPDTKRREGLLKGDFQSAKGLKPWRQVREDVAIGAATGSRADLTGRY